MRPEQTKEDYKLEFFNAYRKAKYPLGGAAIPKAWGIAVKLPPPPEALQFENPQIRLLVSLCRQLQIINGKEPFYLSSRVCQRLLKHDSHTTAANWLGALEGIGILEAVKRGNHIRATRYRYLPPLNL